MMRRKCHRIPAPHHSSGRSRRAGRLGLALAAVVTSLSAGVLLTASPALAVVGWESSPNAAPLPTLDTPDPNPAVNFGDVACASDGTCVAVGDYFSGSGAANPATLDTTYPGAGGVWSATEPPLPAGYPSSGYASQPDEAFTSVACYNSSPGTCIAVGDADDGTGDTQAIIDTFQSGGWTSSAANLPAGYDMTAGAQFAELSGVTCPGAGTCVAVGAYTDGGVGEHEVGLVETLSAGTWTPTEVPGPSGNVKAGLLFVSCASVGTCVAVGAFDAKEPYVDSLSAGTWTSNALAAPTSPAATSSAVGLYALACASDDTCAAIGKYEAAAGTAYAVYSSYQGGAWNVGLSALRVNAGVKSDLASVACPSAGTCVAVGGVSGSGPSAGASLETFTGGAWTQSVAPVPAGGSDGFLDSMTCATDGTCAAVGSYDDVAGNQYALVDTYQANAWSAYPYPPAQPADASPDSAAELTAVACPVSVTGCTAAGDYVNGSGDQLGLIDSTVTGIVPTMVLSVSSFTTTSPGIYTVTLSGGSGTPSGQVSVTDDQGGACPAPITLSGGTGTCSDAGVSAGNGPYTATAYYSGDATYLPTATSITVDPEIADGSGDATAGAGEVTATVSGGSPNSTVVTAEQYASDPVATAPPDTSGQYVDVALTNSTASTSVIIVVCSSAFSAGDDLYWYNAGSWDPITPTTYTSGSPGCLSVTLSSSTTPAPGQLVGTVFGAGSSGGSGLHIVTMTLPNAARRASYRAPLAATGGNPPYKWSVSSGTLPKGLHLSRSTGVISGRPNRNDSGTSLFVVKVVDKKTRRTRGHPSTQDSATQMFGITVS